MRVFVTGATGFIGSALVKDLIAAGHQVIGVCRSDAKAPALAAAGAEVYRGSIDDPDSLKDGAARSDGVIHLAFNHDFSKFAANCDTDRGVIRALGSVLAGSNRPLIVTSGTAIAKVAPGELATEDAPAITSNGLPPRGLRRGDRRLSPRAASTRPSFACPRFTTRSGKGLSPLGSQSPEKRAFSLISERGVTVGPRRIFPMSRASTGWRSKRRSQARVYNAVAEEGVPARDIAETIGRRLKLPVKSIPPEEAGGYFGWLAHLAARDMPASSEQTQKKLGWRPTGPGLIADLERLPVS